MFKSNSGVGQGTSAVGGKQKSRILQPDCIGLVTVKEDMAWALVQLTSGSVLVGYHLNKPPSSESWNGWLGTKKQAILSVGLARVVVFTEGGAPSREQQAQLKGTIYPVWSQRGIKAKVGIQIVTTNQVFGSLLGATVAVIRVGARALGMERIIEFFGSIEGTLEFAGIPQPEWEHLKDVRTYLHQELQSR